MIERGDIALIRSGVPASRLAGARILITGGSGFVGRWMRLACPVTALDRMAYDDGAWERERWDYIVHLAPTGPGRVIQAALASGARLLYASSGAVFDERPDDYSVMKIEGERAVLESGADAVIGRMFTFCGAYMKNRYAVINMIHDALGGSEIRVRSVHTGVQRSYLYAADMAVWMWRALLDGKRGSFYEIGSPVGVTMWELAREVQKHFDPPPLIYHDPMWQHEPRPYYIPKHAIETIEALDVAVYTPFEIAIANTVKHYREERL